MTSKKTIAIDMDGVLANNMQHYLDYHFNETGERISAADIQGLPEISFLPDPNAVRRHLQQPGFFRTLPINPDAQEVVRDLNERFHVFIVSAAMEFPWSLNEKYEWLAEHFPFLNWRQFVFCGDKSIIKADYLIDDHVKNLQTFEGEPLIFSCFHNINESGYERMADWKAVEQYFSGK